MDEAGEVDSAAAAAGKPPAPTELGGLRMVNLALDQIQVRWSPRTQAIDEELVIAQV